MTETGEPSRVTVGRLRELLAELEDRVEVVYRLEDSSHFSYLYTGDISIDREGGLLILEIEP